LAAVLLAATCLTPIIVATIAAPAWADGGQGGGTGAGAGGTGFTGNAGGPGTTILGGGGGGGAGGGAGGAALAGPGGQGGTAISPNGKPGFAPTPGLPPGSISSGSGGGGGWNGNGAGASFITNGASLRGGNGGDGGLIFFPPVVNGGGGGGGAGGYGAIVTGSGTVSSNSSTITGGNGGSGGNAVLGNAGSGGAGGVGVQFTGSGATFVNTGSVTGGNGGGLGLGSAGTANGVAGSGGAGIVGSNLTIVNSGNIAGGMSGFTFGLSPTTRANAITFTGGTNMLELRAGSTITGNVVAFSAADTLRLGGVGTASLDAGLIGPAAQFRNFGQFEKTGTGTWTLTGTSSQTTPWTISQGTLAVNGNITGDVTVATAGTLGGNGTIFGGVINNGTLAPGNSIGTLTISGNYTQAAGSTYQVEVNAAGLGDRVNVGGAATIQGGTVQVLAQPGSYGQRTTYTILNATGGVTGTYSGITSNYAFLSPSLSYDANDVYLTLLLQQNAFSSFSGNTPNQRAVGAALDRAFGSASGDFASVLGVMAGLDTVQGPRALTALSGEPWADFGTMNTNNSALFMNAISQQMAAARGTAGGEQRVAMAEACDIACDLGGRLSAWTSGLGGLGSAMGDGNASTLTYNFGGVAVGVDYRIDPRFLVGFGAGYTAGSLWVDGFTGRGWSDSVAVAAYGSFTQGALYADAQVGYAYFNNRLQRQIAISGLQPRTASGSTSANQVFGQVETGYKIGIFAPASATVTPFARLQASSGTQDGFTEWGAESLDLAMRAQTTNALRTTFGADLAGSIDIGATRTLDLRLRLGWQHEFADTGRPITAAFAGAPSAAFTVYGATPMRDSAVLGLEARTQIADATQLFLRYDGEIASGTDNHALNVGMRLTW